MWIFEGTNRIESVLISQVAGQIKWLARLANLFNVKYSQLTLSAIRTGYLFLGSQNSIPLIYKLKI